MHSIRNPAAIHAVLAPPARHHRLRQRLATVTSCRSAYADSQSACSSGTAVM
ncbi:hypothetical protein [Streptomyces sp. NPDC014734]|uniref:hypothetical protein n=1 Tax=Streptomyces sp. NPDC014734 TaxID=3364886 RepID=UPI0036FED3F3